MTALTVIEPRDGKLSHELSLNLARRGAAGIAVLSARSPESADPDCDLLVVASGWTPSGESRERRPRCGILLMPGGIAAPADAKSVVTYGMSPKSTLTLSSIGRDECVLALQRELVTTHGGVLDRQEMKISAGGSADDLLAVSGTMLLLGLTPD